MEASYMQFQCLVLDFDGTFTDVEQEAAPFFGAYREQLCGELGPGADRSWDEAYARIEQAPADFGWEYDGRIVAPSQADPYIRATAIAQILLEDYGYDPAGRSDLLENLYRSNYEKSHTVFRPEARDVAEALLALETPVFVVTNSHTDAVQKKIESLAPKGLEKLTLFGNAKKYVVAEAEDRDSRFDGLPESTSVDGLSRPILLRRGRYYELLREIWTRTATSPEGMLVCGDIFELDLAMPAALGAHVHLVTRAGTPEYEVRAARNHPRGATSEDLSGLLTRLGL
ncbi:MAG: HAD family hydrolase [Myxococcales bacterium]|nr:HAD family hydrolase [Myxococcales bacterium]